MKTEDLLRYDEEIRALREALGVYTVSFEFEHAASQAESSKAADAQAGSPPSGGAGSEAGCRWPADRKGPVRA
jgi:hypothetical protein